MATIGPRLRKLQTETDTWDHGTRNKKLHSVSAMSSADVVLSKFWKHELIRLKFHNPAVSMTVDRSVKTEEEAFLTVFFAPKDAAKTSGAETGGTHATTSTSGDKVASDHTPSEKTESVSISHKLPHEILQDLVRLTDAEIIDPEAEDVQLEKDLAEQDTRSQADREQSMALNAEKKRQADLLAEARGQTA
ncbi:hypothetical protein ANO11243_026040 [Dothideomycetidae sp. 11243]|nr:hypothetical protein ANO11243_026040 [fungal sp. No.11243]